MSPKLPRDYRWGDDLLLIGIGVWLARLTGDWWTFVVLMLVGWVFNAIGWIVWQHRQGRPVNPYETFHGPQG